MPTSPISKIYGYLLPIENFSINPADSNLKPIWFQQRPSISESQNANYVSSGIPFSANKYQFYNGADAKTIRLGLTYIAYEGRLENSPNSYWSIVKVATRLNGLLLPKFSRRDNNNPDFVPPDIVLLNYGDFYINVPCVVTGVSTTIPDDAFLQLQQNSATVEGISSPVVGDWHYPQIIKIDVSLVTQYPYGYAPGGKDLEAETNNREILSYLPIKIQDPDRAYAQQ